MLSFILSPHLLSLQLWLGLSRVLYGGVSDVQDLTDFTLHGQRLGEVLLGLLWPGCSLLEVLISQIPGYLLSVLLPPKTQHTRTELSISKLPTSLHNFSNFPYFCYLCCNPRPPQFPLFAFTYAFLKHTPWSLIWPLHYQNKSLSMFSMHDQAQIICSQMSEILMMTLRLSVFRKAYLLDAVLGIIHRNGGGHWFCFM